MSSMVETVFKMTNCNEIIYYVSFKFSFASHLAYHSFILLASRANILCNCVMYAL